MLQIYKVGRLVKSKSIPGKKDEFVLCLALWPNAPSLPEIDGISGPSLPLLTQKMGGEKSAQTFLLNPISDDEKIIRHGDQANSIGRKCAIIPWFAMAKNMA